MRNIISLSRFLLTFLLGAFFICSQAYADVPVAKITGFQGEAVIMSGTQFASVTQVGQTLNNGDFVQTKQGSADITFSDGAVMNVRPFTNVAISERKVQAGSPAKRLITCFVGRLRFKSGQSQMKNYLQTPTAVCGLRGSEEELGFEPPESTYLTIFSGDVDIIGDVFKGPFDWNSTSNIALKSAVFGLMQEAYEAFVSAQALEGPERDLAVAEARLKALDVARGASNLIQQQDPNLEATGYMLGATELDEETEKAKEDVRRAREALSLDSSSSTTTSTISTTTTSKETTVSPSS